MNNDIINWPGDEPQNSEGQEPRNNEMIPLDQYYTESQQTRTDDREWWLRRGYRDNDGIELNAIGLILLAAVGVFLWQEPQYILIVICLAINVLLHEYGHYAAGRIFRCVVRKVSVFFVPVISYKNRAASYYNPDTHSWRDTVWTLGALPFGGFTTFESVNYPAPADSRRSPFLNHKPAWQRLIINTAGVIVNFATFLMCYAINGFSFIILGDHPWLSTMMYMSLVLSIINLLPLYPLDGAAAATSIYEIYTGHEPPKKFMTIFRIVGVVLFVYLFWIDPTILNKLISLIMGG